MDTQPLPLATIATSSARDCLRKWQCGKLARETLTDHLVIPPIPFSSVDELMLVEWLSMKLHLSFVKCNSRWELFADLGFAIRLPYWRSISVWVNWIELQSVWQKRECHCHIATYIWAHTKTNHVSIGKLIISEMIAFRFSSGSPLSYHEGYDANEGLLLMI